MSDRGLRGIERRWQRTGAVEDEASYLGERIRAGELSTRALVRAALLGSPAARLITDDFNESELEDLSQEDMNEVFRLVFGGIEIPERTREFLGNIVQHDREARATIDHYGLVEKGDKAPPDRATALKVLMDDLRSTPEHFEAINQMQRPVLQLIPVYEPEGTGFQKMVNALDAHQREGQINTYVRNELRTRWRMTEESRGKIVGWQVAVTEGAKVLPQESNPYAGQRLEDQLTQWQQDCKRRNLQLCDKRFYNLLQMQEIRTAPPGTPLGQLGIDPENWTILEDSTRQTGSLVPYGRWFAYRVSFYGFDPDVQYVGARFRPSVVVDM